MSLPRYWPYDRPPVFVQCVRSFAEARLLRQPRHSDFTIQQPLAPPCVCSEWHVPSPAISGKALPKKRRRMVRGSAAGAVVPRPAQLPPLQLTAMARVRVGTAGFISKLLERLFERRGIQRRDAGKFVQSTLRRACSACMGSRAFPSMRARPFPADSAEATLIVVRLYVTTKLIPKPVLLNLFFSPASFLTIRLCSKWLKRF
jgi:hypothetical protein